MAQLYADRWQIEVNLRHLKQTLHLDVLRCKTVAGVHKELLMIALAYNLVRLVMLRAAETQGVSVPRELHRRAPLALSGPRGPTALSLDHSAAPYRPL